jgi:hypothetical protein
MYVLFNMYHRCLDVSFSLAVNARRDNPRDTAEPTKLPRVHEPRAGGLHQQGTGQAC